MKRYRALIAILLIASSASAQTPTQKKVRKDVKMSPITKDITIIAWVDATPILLLSDANQTLQDNLNAALTCFAQLNDWRNGTRSNITNNTDRQYANAYLLRNSPNAAPPATINPTSVGTAGDYRLFNRGKVEFQIQDGRLTGTRRFINEGALVGKTAEPCSWLGATGIVKVAGEAHPDHAAQGGTQAGNIYQLAEGRIGADGQKVDRTLNDCSQSSCSDIPFGPTTPWIWATLKFDLQGNFIQPIDKQIFPTYSIYQNGQRVGSAIPQSDAEVFISKDADSMRKVTDIQ